ncbi:ATP-binding cassette domain-containing protein, partial [Arsenicicoccus bolidensis]
TPTPTPADRSVVGASARPELTSRREQPAERSRHDTGVARLEGVTYRYPGATRDVLHDLTLTAAPGLTVITGPSGTGKTTALELLCGLREPTTGTASLVPSHLVTQRPFLTAGSIRANLTLADEADDDRLWSVLRQVGLEDLVRGLPDGLGTPLGDDGFGLSAGQRARLGMARALLSTAPLVALDEPTAHLDPASTALVDDVVRSLARDRAVIVVTHRASLVEHADHLVTLSPVVQEVAR